MVLSYRLFLPRKFISRNTYQTAENRWEPYFGKRTADLGFCALLIFCQPLLKRGLLFRSHRWKSVYAFVYLYPILGILPPTISAPKCLAQCTDGQ